MRAGDPGFGRLTAALSIVVAVASVLPWHVLVGTLLDYPPRAAAASTLFGGVVAIFASNALAGGTRAQKVRTAVWLPVASGIGLVVATLVDGTFVGQVVGFGAGLFLAVWVRRFGPDFFFYGFLGFMGLFFGTFLRADLALLPELGLASVVSTAWVLVLRTTVFQSNPRRVLRSTTAAFFADGRALAREAADLLEVPPGATRRRDRAVASLEARRDAATEASLLTEAWSSEPGAVPEGWSAAAVRRRMIETQQALDRIVAGTRELVALAGHEDEAGDLRAEARRMLDHVGAYRDDAARAASGRLDRLADEAERDGLDAWWAARRTAYGVRELLRFEAAGADPPEVDPGEEEFEATTTLVFGGLPGSPAVSGGVAPRGRWNPARHLSLTTRQGLQAMLAGLMAVALGVLLSPTRWYWAVLTAFIVFTGTSSRSETFYKGIARVVGTLVGIGAAIGLAHLTEGDAPLALLVFLVALFGAFYLAKVSQTAMTFFITVLLGEMYVLLGSFTDGLMAVRLGETLVGAATGAVVALVFAPLSTRDTVRSARDELLTDIADLLDAVADLVERSRRGERPVVTDRVDLDARVHGLDDRARRLLLVARPIARSFVGGLPPRVRRRLGLYTAAVSQCRALSLAVQRTDEVPDARVAEVCDLLAEGVRVLRGHPVASPTPEAAAVLERAGRSLATTSGSRPGTSPDDDPLLQHLHHLGATLRELAKPDDVA